MQSAISVLLALWGLVVVLTTLRSLVRVTPTERLVAVFLSVVLCALALYQSGLIGRGSNVQFLMLGLASVCGLFAFLPGRTAVRRPIHPDLMLPALVTFVLFLSNALSNPTVSMESLFARLAPLAFWLVVALVLSHSPASGRTVAAASGLALAVVTITGLATDPWRACDQFKCGIFGAIYTGPFGSENYLAQLAGIAVIAALGPGLGRLRGAIIVFACAVLIVATSRTALLTVLVAVAFGLWAARRSTTARYRVVGAGVVVGAVTSWYVVATAHADSYSNRGAIWMRALRAVEGNGVFGVGIDRWSQLQALGLLPPTNFPHNQLVLLFFASGVIGCAVYIIMLWRVSRRGVAARHSAPAVAGMLGYLLMSGITEVMWNPATIDGHCFAVLAFLALRSVADQDDVPTAGSDVGQQHATPTSPRWRST
ncbi:O-antigen ligase family protein [Microbacterium trichothecenolyticum]|uniref:O-antigen ligase family protein n=1 Tax=Microbacterium trichothecenolyticum TaxID=69370 RepID=UPI001C6F06D9|nr:O-antigen ligase family protein [Microbacterium trichothecenolyticum]MBW9122395.1 O-antigen ligase family protein [Microbacterium trichothecenolyticum]